MTKPLDKIVTTKMKEDRAGGSPLPKPNPKPLKVPSQTVPSTPKKA